MGRDRRRWRPRERQGEVGTRAEAGGGQDPRGDRRPGGLTPSPRASEGNLNPLCTNRTSPARIGSGSNCRSKRVLAHLLNPRSAVNHTHKKRYI